jgi:hypothetical protein
MRIGTILLAAVACGAMACSTFEQKPDRSSPRIACTGNKCDAKVTVASSGAWCRPDPILPIDLSTGEHGGKTVTWTIETEGYEFSNESYKFAIFIKDDPFDEFKDAKVIANGKRLTITFNERLPGKAYRYAVTVRKSTPNKEGHKEFCETLDPWLLN